MQRVRTGHLAATMSLRLTRTIVDKDGKGFVEFNVAEAALPSAADLEDDEVCAPFSSARVVHLAHLSRQLGVPPMVHPPRLEGRGLPGSCTR